MEAVQEALKNLQTEKLDNNTVVLLQALVNSAEVFANNIDSAFLIICSIFIFFMQAGFAFLECGAVRRKNTTNILIKNMLDAFIGCAAYWSIGYSFAFGHGTSFIGYHYFFTDINGQLPPTRYSHWFFHFVFAVATSTIVSGSVAERCNFQAYFGYSFLITGFVYPVAAHWAWSSQGWLGNASIPYYDFSGSGVVHLLGGTAALVGAWILGPRKGRFRSDGTPQNIKGHSVPLTGLGGFILIVGFLAFTGGAQTSLSKPGDGEAVARNVINTVMGATFAAFTALYLNKYAGSRQWSFLVTLNASLTGIVSICAGCNVYHPWAAAVVGTISGLVYIGASLLVLYVMHIDDPLDAVAVHAGGGLWGVIAAPIFRVDKGIVYSFTKSAFKGLEINVLGALSIITWSGGVCTLIFGTFHLLGILRVSTETEEKGLDIVKHGEPAYPDHYEGRIPDSPTADKLIIVGGAPVEF